MAQAAVRRMLGMILAGAVMTSALVGGVAAVAVAETTGVTTSCAPVTVLAFRGSGETNAAPAVAAGVGAPFAYGDSGLVTNGWEGPTLQRLLARLAPQAATAGLPVIGVGPSDIQGVPGYAAAAADPTNLSGLAASAQLGAAAAELIIGQVKARAMAEKCQIAPRFIAVGYSQGALAARVLEQLNPIDVVGVVTMGDPAQKPNASGNVGAGAAGDGLLRWLTPYFGDKFDGVYGHNTATAALCHLGDPVCDFGWQSIWRVTTGAYSNHAYFVSEADLAPATQALQALAGDARLKPAPAFSGDPAAHVAASVFAVENVPTLISAVGSQVSSGLATYEFDLTGDGFIDLENTSGLANFVFTSGAHSVTVWVTANSLTSKSTTVIDVAPASAALAKTALGTPTFAAASTAPEVAVGANLPLAVLGAPANSALTLLLVPAVSASPWGAEPAFSIRLTTGWETTGVPVPSSLATGKYFVVVGADSGGWGTSTVQIVAAPRVPEVDPGVDPGTGTDPGAEPVAQPTTPLAAVPPTTVPSVGQAIVVVDGVRQAVTVARAPGNPGVTVNGPGFAVTAQALTSAGAPVTVDANTVLVLERNGSVTVSGNGFKPNTSVEVYLFSVATPVGSAPVNASGSMSKTFTVPTSIAAGSHTLQIVGLAPNGTTRVIDVGVRVGNQPVSAAVLASTGVNLSGVLGSALLVLLAGVALTVRARRRGVRAF